MSWTGILYKASDESRASTTTLADDADLVLILNASKKYRFRLQFLCWANATADFKWTILAGAATAGAYAMWGPQTMTTVVSANWETATNTGYYGHLIANITAGTARNVNGNNTSTARAIISCQGMIETPSSSPGTLAFQWAQNTSNATAAVVYAGSFLAYKEI